MARITANEEGPDLSDLPPEAEHIIVTTEHFDGHNPDGFPENEMLLYERGDEVPFEKHKEALVEMPSCLAALDSDGEIVFGDDRHESGGLALQRWKEGDVFDPSEYDDSE